MLAYQLHQKLRAAQAQAQQQQSTSSNSFDFTTLQKPFWIWDKKEHLAKLSEGQCCWNHIVGLPVKDRKEYPIFGTVGTTGATSMIS